MRLLFITRKIDKKDPRTGFVWGWVSDLAGALTVGEKGTLQIITLEKSDYSSEFHNISGTSIRKNGKNWFLDLVRYISLLLKIVPNVDAIFVHQHPVYAIVAAPFVKFYRKKIILWYTHKQVDLKLRIATFLVDAIFTASKESFRLETKKPVEVMGHGIDNNFIPRDFIRGYSKPRSQNDTFIVLTVGRISPVKGLEVLIEAAAILHQAQQGTIAKIRIVGATALKRDEDYLELLKKKVKDFGLEGVVEFVGPKPHDEIVSEYQNADLFINLSDTGSLDKAVLEAMICGVPVVTSNEAFRTMLQGVDGKLFIGKRKETVAEAIKYVMEMSPEERRSIGKVLHDIASDHNLNKFAGNMKANIKKFL